jgi:hypothetical protein
VKVNDPEEPLDEATAAGLPLVPTIATALTSRAAAAGHTRRKPWQFGFLGNLARPPLAGPKTRAPASLRCSTIVKTSRGAGTWTDRGLDAPEWPDANLGEMASEGFGSWHHLAGRFFGALSPAGPPASDEAWARGTLLDGEQALWGRMSGPDRRHAVGVARESIRLLDDDAPPREVVAAALLHDVGKVESCFGTFARVGITLAAMTAGRKRLVGWAGQSPKGSRPSVRARVGLYLAHDRVGADLLERAGSHQLTVTWAREHHMPSTRWTVDSNVGGALKAADGD